MGPFRCLLLAALVIVSSFWLRPASAAPIDEVIAAAKKEGVLELHAASTLGPTGAQALAAATAEAQQLLDKHLGFSSVHVKGTRAHKFAQGKNWCS